MLSQASYLFTTIKSKMVLVGVIKRSIVLLLLVAGVSSCQITRPRELTVLTTTEQVRSLSAEEAARGYPVRLTGQVTYKDDEWRYGIIQDETGGAFIKGQEAKDGILWGTGVLMGRTAVEGNLPVVLASDYKWESENNAKYAPQKISLKDLTEKNDLRYYSTIGVVRNVSLQDGRLTFLLAAEKQRVQVVAVEWWTQNGLPAELLDAVVQINGVYGPTTRGDQIFTDRCLYMNHQSENFKVLLPPTRPDQAPTIKISDLRADPDQAGQIHRKKLHGTVIRQSLGRSLTIRDSSGELEVLTSQPSSFPAGTEVEVYGFPVKQNGQVVIEDARVTHFGEALQPDPLDSLYVQSFVESRPQLLTTVRQIKSLPMPIVAHHLPVRIKGIVTACDPGSYLFVVQDETGGIYASTSEGWNNWKTNVPRPGQIVEVEGISHPGGYAPSISQAKVKIVGEGKMPKVREVLPAELFRGSFDNEYLAVEGEVRSMRVFGNRLSVTIAVGTNRIDVQVSGDWNGALPQHLLDARVLVKGVWLVQANSRRQQIFGRIVVPSLNQIEVIKQSPVTSAEVLPLTNIRFLRQYNPNAISSRVRLRGTVTLALPFGSFFMRDDMNAIRVQSANSSGVQAGDQVEVIGIPIFESGALVLQDTIVKKLGSGTLPEPIAIKAEQGLDIRYDFQYVTFEAQFIGRIPSADGYTYLLESGPLVFNAALPRRTATDMLANVQKGSLVRLTGICVVKYQSVGLGSTRQLPGSFDLILPGPESIVVLQNPPWWTVQKAIWLLTIAVLIGILAAAWVLLLRRRVRHQTDVIRKRMESEAVLEERFKNLFENAQDAVYTLDIHGRFTSMNRAGTLLTEYPEEEIRQMTIADLVAPESIGNAQAALNDKIKGERAAAYEVEIITKAGRRVPLEVNSALIAEQDGKASVLGIARDITVRKQIEAELQRARDEALQSAKLKSEFLANMSHEIRTPMNGIIGMTELALETRITPEQRDYLTTVKSSADALLTVINDILDFSKIEAGKMDLDCVDFNLHDSLHDAIKPLAFKAAQKGLEIICDFAPDVPEVVIGDSGRLRQVLINLIGNSIKFTERGEIALKVKLAEGGHSDDQVKLHFSVHDTGIGIPVEKQSKIFEAFSQADGSTTRQFGGTGLGLTISMRLVEMMGGRIWVESVPDEGSTFHFTASMKIGDHNLTLPVPAATAQLRGLHVLIVDDNATNRQVLEQSVKSFGMEAELAADAEIGLARMLEAQRTGKLYDLVILDVHMPRIDGFELAKQIKQHSQLSGMKMLMLTSAGQTGDGTRCRELGISGYLSKPTKKSELLEAICAIFGQDNRTEEAPLITKNRLREPRVAWRILLAEDNLVNQKLAQRLLEREGHQVKIVGNGREAVTAVQNESFDLVLMDVQMPEMDGLEATAKIREWEKTGIRRLPIIALTAHAMKGDRDRCLEAGMDGYISKPIKIDELMSTIEGLMSART